MDALALICLLWTLLAYYLARKIHAKKPLMILSPVVTVSVSTILLMALLHISYDTYHQYTQGIVFLLGPVTVAFAVPIYENREVIRRQLPVLSVSIIVGMFVGVVSAFLARAGEHFCLYSMPVAAAPLRRFRRRSHPLARPGQRARSSPRGGQ